MRDLILSTSPPRESIRYAARPGLGALPAGTGTWFVFGALQLLPLITFLWAIWWPAPLSPREYAFSIGLTALIAALVVGVVWLLIRRAGASALGVAIAPFMRLTVSDRRVLWHVPWRRAPLIEIGAERVRGGLLGEVDARGRGAAAIILHPGDYAADAHGLVHFHRLPRVAEFVDALRLMA